MNLLNTILNIVFPIKCAVCGKSNTQLCDECFCNIPRSERSTSNWIYPLYNYKNKNMRNIIHGFKYKNKKGLAKPLGSMLQERILEEWVELESLQNFRNPIIIPIPLSKERKRERGFNQTELLMEEIKKQDTNGNFKYEKKILKRKNDNSHQARIKNKQERLKNIVGAFYLDKQNKHKIKNQNIILIDDVVTTGGTLSEARKTLKSGGAKKVIAFTVAH